MKDKVKTIIIVIITIILTAGTTVAASIAISASNIIIDSDKTDKTNVADAIDDLYDMSELANQPSICVKEVSGKYKCPSSMPKCIRANPRKLHIEICESTDTTKNCSSTDSNYNGTDIVSGSIIKYGNKSNNKGILKVGDAFTCDVNGDGIYDEETERFYYVSDLYTGTTSNVDQFNSNVAVLIYYTNVIISGDNVLADNSTTIAYDDSRANKNGPKTASQYLPTKTQWSNVNLTNESRQIRNELGGTTTTAGTNNISIYTYTNKAARFITTQEINKNCPIGVSKNENPKPIINGELDTPECRFLLENTNYIIGGDDMVGYWLETPNSLNYNHVWNVYGSYRFVNNHTAEYALKLGVRPAIEVAKTDISY